MTHGAYLMIGTTNKDGHARINVYQNAGTWYAATWIGGEYDSCEPLDATTRRGAIAEAEAMPLRGVASREVRVRKIPRGAAMSTAPEEAEALFLARCEELRVT